MSSYSVYALRGPLAVYHRISLHALDEINTAGQCWKGDVNLQLVAFHDDAASLLLVGDINNLDKHTRHPVSKLLNFELTNAAGTDYEQEVWVRVYRSNDPALAKSLSSRPLAGMAPSLVDEMMGRLGPQGVCFALNIRRRGTFCQRFDLRAFPFDTQHLTVEFTLLSEVHSVCLQDTLAGGEAGRDVWEEGAGNIIALDPSNCPAREEWDLVAGITSSLGVSLPTSSWSKAQYSHAKYTFTAHRRVTHFLWNAFLPTFLVTVTCHTVWFMRHDELNQRLGVLVTLLLALLAHRTTILTGYLPRISYNTLSDWYNTSCLFLVFVATVVVTWATDNSVDAEAQAARDVAVFAAWRVAMWTLQALFFLIVAHLLQRRTGTLLADHPPFTAESTAADGGEGEGACMDGRPPQLFAPGGGSPTCASSSSDTMSSTTAHSSRQDAQREVEEGGEAGVGSGRPRGQASRHKAGAGGRRRKGSTSR